MHSRIPDLTLHEKAGLLSGASFWRTRAVERAGIPSAVLTDGPHGVRMQRGSADHLGLNGSEPATAFPTAAATGSTWDPELLEEMGKALGRESLALGVDVVLGPGVNIKRSPLGGRSFEYFSEDPLLSGVLGAAWVRGIESQGVGASVKHYAANNQETNRMSISADVDERTLREIYLPAFERTVIDGKPSTIMCSYNKVNGVFASENAWLLTEVLRAEWGFDGYVVSDWGAVVDAVAAVEAGLDLEMPGTGDRSPTKIVDAVRAGRLDEAVLDRAVTRILTVHERLLARRSPGIAAVDHAAHHGLARRIAVASTVLLRNDGNILPLDRVAGSVAVVGEFARTPRFQGAGSSFVNPTRLDTALDAITGTAAGPVTFAAGFRLDGEQDQVLLDEAVTAASAADTVVLFLGLPAAEESEGFDRTHLHLPEVQQTLAAAVLSANPRTVVVLSNGSVVAFTGVIDAAPAVVESWLGGQAGGCAIADVLFGDAEPGGRLATTIPHALEHTPAHTNWPGADGHVLYGERIYVGYRWYDSTDRDVAYPFGYGLSYTTFEYTDLDIVQTPGEAHVTVAFTVRNTGNRAGCDVPQVYVGDVEASVDRPVRELKGFRKVHLNAGEEQRVVIDLDARAFAFWGRTGWTVEPGAYTIEVGSHSRDPRLVDVLHLDVPAPVPALDEDSTLEAWLRHPVGAAIIGDLFSGLADAGTIEMAGTDPIKLMGGMPLRTLLNFQEQAADDSYDTAAVLQDLLSKARGAQMKEMVR